MKTKTDTLTQMEFALVRAVLERGLMSLALTCAATGNSPTRVAHIILDADDFEATLRATTQQLRDQLAQEEENLKHG